MRISFKYFLLSLIALLVVGVLVMIYGATEFAVFPNSEVFVGTYHEGELANPSAGDLDTNVNNDLLFHYKLSEQLEEPFAAVFFKPRNKNRFFDFSNIDEIVLALEAEKSERIPITFTVDVMGFTDTLNPLTNMPFTAVVTYSKDVSNYVVALDEFEVPSWWYRFHNKTAADFKGYSLERVNHFVIGSCQALGRGGEDTIVISDVHTLGKPTSVYAVLGVFFVLSLTWFGISEISRRKSKVVVSYEPVTIPDRKKEGVDLVEDFLFTHYKSPELTLDWLADEVGISSRAISQGIKERYGKSFKEHLNDIRIEEVKRLLTQSDSPVSDIAYAVGYNNISHFNRVFKNVVGESPNSFRKKKE